MSLRLDELALTELLKCEPGKLETTVANLTEIHQNLDILDPRLQFLFKRKSGNKPAITYLLQPPSIHSPKLLIRALRNLLSQAKNDGDVEDINYLLEMADFRNPQKTTKRSTTKTRFTEFYLEIEIPVTKGGFILEHLDKMPRLKKMLKQNFQISNHPVLKFNKGQETVTKMLDLFEKIKPRRLVINENWHKLIQKNEKDEVGLTIVRFLDEIEGASEFDVFSGVKTCFVKEITICDFDNYSHDYEFGWKQANGGEVSIENADKMNRQIQKNLLEMNSEMLSFDKITFTSRDINRESDQVTDWFTNFSVFVVEQWKFENLAFAGSILLIEMPLFSIEAVCVENKGQLDLSQVDYDTDYQSNTDEYGNYEKSSHFLGEDFSVFQEVYFFGKYKKVREVSVCDFQITNDYKVHHLLKLQTVNLLRLNVYVTDAKHIEKFFKQGPNDELRALRRKNSLLKLLQPYDFMELCELEKSESAPFIIRFIIFNDFTYSRSSKAKSIKTCIKQMAKRYFKYDVQIEYKFEKANECLHPFLFKKIDNVTDDKDIFLSCMKNK